MPLGLEEGLELGVFDGLPEGEALGDLDGLLLGEDVGKMVVGPVGDIVVGLPPKVVLLNVTLVA